MLRSEALDFQSRDLLVEYLGETYYIRWLSPPAKKPEIALIAKTLITRRSSNGKVIGDPYPKTVYVKDLKQF